MKSEPIVDVYNVTIMCTYYIYCSRKINHLVSEPFVSSSDVRSRVGNSPGQNTALGQQSRLFENLQELGWSLPDVGCMNSFAAGLSQQGQEQQL
jgi:hypothetical protein